MSSGAETRVGPYILEDLLGAGSAGHVHRARHAASETPVAIKFLSQPLVQKTGLAESLRREVESMAKLHHPSIAAVLDTGMVGEEFELDGVSLSPEIPWIAMEYVDGEPLSEYSGKLPWPALQRILFDLLEGLADAHAQGVVHRDIKPDNIMLVERDGRLAPKIVDFGIASALDSADKGEVTLDGEAAAIGTPNFMAPEQIEGAWRDQGPWTDLYSVGCAVWQFVTGRPPFSGSEPLDILESHLYDPLPFFNPTMQVPAELEQWLRRLLVKKPSQRIQRAMTAAQVLMTLPRRPESSDGSAGWFGVSSPEAQAFDGQAYETPPVLQSGLFEMEDLEPQHSRGFHAVALPRLPDHWEVLTPPRPPVQLAGAGLELYGLRTVPVVGRRRERDALWDALRECAQRGERRFVWLTGEPGVGKSRLARWASEAAHSAGAFEVVKAVHGSEGGGPMDGLGAMLERFFGCHGMDRAGMRARLVDVFENHGWTDRLSQLDLDVYLEMMAPTEFEAEGTQPSARVRGTREKYFAVERLFERITLERPLVVWLDDVQHSVETQGLISFLVKRARENPLPMLVLVTSRRDDLSTLSVQQAYHDSWYFPGASHLDVSALEDDAMQELVTRLLGLESELAERVVERADGRPLFAVQIVDDLVERDQLDSSEEGFRLKPGAEPELPDDIHAMWLQRLESLVDTGASDEHEPDELWRTLEIAAFLGQEVAAREWLACCGQAGLTVPGSILEGLASRNLVERSDQGWTFTHSLLGESLERHAQENGRAREHHLHCSEGLANLYGPSSARVAFRRAIHLVEADRLREAMVTLEGATMQFVRWGEPERATEVLDFQADLLEKLDVGEHDEARVAHELSRARLLRVKGRAEEALELAKEALDISKQQGHEQLRVKATDVYGLSLAAMGRFEESIPYLEDVMEEAHLRGMYELVAEAAGSAAMARKWLGEHDLAYEYFEVALDAYKKVGDRRGEARMRANMAGHYKRKDTVDASIAETLEALDIARDTADRQLIGNVSNGLAELYRFDGQLDMAARYYEEAYDHLRACGTTGRFVAVINLMSTYLARGEFDRVIKLTTPLVKALPEKEPKYVSFVFLGHAAAHAALGHREKALRYTEEAAEHVMHAVIDLLKLAEHVIEHAKRQGWSDVLAVAEEIAADQREQLGEMLESSEG